MQTKKLSIEEALKSEVINQKTFEKAERSKPGRKRKSEDEKVKYNIALYFNKQDFEFLGKMAEKEDETIQRFCKKIIARFLKSAKTSVWLSISKIFVFNPFAEWMTYNDKFDKCNDKKNTN